MKKKSPKVLMLNVHDLTLGWKPDIPRSVLHTIIKGDRRCNVNKDVDVEVGEVVIKTTTMDKLNLP